MSHLEIKNLVKQYGSNTVVKDLNIAINRGEMLSLLGPSGCGKSTTLRMIAGLQDPTSGSILLGQRDLTKVPPHKRDVGLVFQNYALFPHLNMYDNVAFGLRRKGVPKSEIKDRVEAALRSVQLSSFVKRFPAQLSGGQQQRVALARTLVLQPTLVLFDEPLSNLDAKLRQALGIEIRSLQKEFGFTGIFVTHDQEEAMVLSDRIAVMNHGRIVQIGTPQQIYTEPADSFVADFVGESNLVEASALDAGNGKWRFELPGGQKIMAEKTVKAASPTYVMVRPETVEVLPEGTGLSDVRDLESFNSLSGNVSFIHYTGASYLIGVVIEKMDKHFIARLNQTTKELGLQIGDKVQVRWPVQSTRIF
ncbi:ABC transporter ATP-binding protein [Paenibacillus sp. URB8-2]|uniref:ABC transporter ATP-binding protein n=1 Tax=Paenibacillus sp. URB8-2 TaxID=2741301 RepID=UPI0015BEDCFA|nr:ABC transporter ATP-binding protein [Paenibacillus sp. URB8-2]BCG61639.1 polyamine ABC transporter ATP-binding protein [Paenibacillus sp. URB8-2]